MKPRNLLAAFLTLALASSTFAPSVAAAEGSTRYEVTVTNLTPGNGPASGQILNGLVLATHNDDIRLFTLGQPADAGLAALAEDADTTVLVPALLASPDVKDVQTNPDDPILPGDSASVIVEADKKHRLLSLAAMLVTTNDAFAGLNGVRLPKKGQAEFFAVAYDAGSEANTENCSDIPGPPCGNPFSRVPAGAEGYVSIHSGIHGIGSPLEIFPEERDWRNPVAWITVRALGNSQRRGAEDDRD